MKPALQYKKSLAAMVLACLVLLFGQAACCLALPGLLGDLVNTGIQQGGMEAGMPEAISLQGMTLLKCFMPEEDSRKIDGLYNEFAPESMEAQRFAAAYPLAAKTAVCVLREDLTRQDAAYGAAVYGKAAYAFLLYLRQAQETGELQETAQKFSNAQASDRTPGEFGENLKEPGGGESSLPNGVLGSVPDDALFRLPGEETSSEEQEAVSEDSGNMMEFNGRTFGEDETSAPETQTQDEAAKSGFSVPRFDLSAAGLAGLDMEQVYALLPLLAQAPQDRIQKAVESAAAAGAGASGGTGVVLKKRFYAELGVDVEKAGSDYVWRTGGKLLGVMILELAASAAAALLLSHISAGVGRKLRQDLFGPSGAVCTNSDVRQMQKLVKTGIPALCCAPVLGVGGAVLALGPSPSARRIVCLAVALLAGIAFAAVWLAPVKPKFLQKPAEKIRLLGRKNPKLLAAGRCVPLLISAVMLLMNVAGVIAAGVGSRAIAGSALRVGNMMAFAQYAVQVVLACLTVAAVLALLPEGRAAAGRIQKAMRGRKEKEQKE